MENKKGFISTALVYSFLVIYLFLMVSIINMYINKTAYLDALDEQVAEDIGITKNTRKTLLTLMLENDVALETTGLINFNDISNSTNKNGNGLYYIDEFNLPQYAASMTDENHDGFGKKIYYYRGNVEKNYVVFGKTFDRDSNNDIITGTDKIKSMCWRILRTNENGSIRLIFYGFFDETSDTCVEGTLMSGKYNSNNNDNAYVGYTYHGVGQSTYNETHHGDETTQDKFEQIDSTVKGLVDNFYLYKTDFYSLPGLSYQISASEKLDVVGMKDKISDALYCNDRAATCVNVATGGDETTCGYGTITTKYGYDKTKMSTYICNGFYDKYMLSPGAYGGNDIETNLSYAIALPTVSEIVMAGGYFNTKNDGYFMKSSTAYWTMSPSSFDGVAKVYAVDTEGKIIEKDVASDISIRPVISVKEDITVKTGFGLKSNPYILD